MFWVWFAIIGAFFILCVKIFKLSCGKCTCSKHLVGKTAIVTGGNTGIGYESAKDFADRGARVILACRNEKRGTTARDTIIAETGNEDVYYYNLDLSSFKSVRAFAEKVINNEKRLDILVNNAGDVDLDEIDSEDGILLGMEINYFSPFLLTNLLLPLLKASAPSRIINVASMGHHAGNVDLNNLTMKPDAIFTKIKIYCNAKLCTILMNLELSKRLEGSGVTANSLCPGFVNTNIIHKMRNPLSRYFQWTNAYFLAKTPWEGAQTQIYLAVSPKVNNISGSYFMDCKETKAAKKARDPALAKKLWDISEKIVNL